MSAPRYKVDPKWIAFNVGPSEILGNNFTVIPSTNTQIYPTYFVWNYQVIPSAKKADGTNLNIDVLSAEEKQNGGPASITNSLIVAYSEKTQQVLWFRRIAAHKIVTHESCVNPDDGSLVFALVKKDLSTDNKIRILNAGGQSDVTWTMEVGSSRNLVLKVEKDGNITPLCQPVGQDIFVTSMCMDKAKNLYLHTWGDNYTSTNLRFNLQVQSNIVKATSMAAARQAMPNTGLPYASCLWKINPSFEIKWLFSSTSQIIDEETMVELKISVGNGDYPPIACCMPVTQETMRFDQPDQTHTEKTFSEAPEIGSICIAIVSSSGFFERLVYLPKRTIANSLQFNTENNQLGVCLFSGTPGSFPVFLHQKTESSLRTNTVLNSVFVIITDTWIFKMNPNNDAQLAAEQSMIMWKSCRYNNSEWVASLVSSKQISFGDWILGNFTGYPSNGALVCFDESTKACKWLKQVKNALIIPVSRKENSLSAILFPLLLSVGSEMTLCDKDQNKESALSDQTACTSFNLTTDTGAFFVNISSLSSSASPSPSLLPSDKPTKESSASKTVVLYVSIAIFVIIVGLAVFAWIKSPLNSTKEKRINGGEEIGGRNSLKQ